MHGLNMQSAEKDTGRLEFWSDGVFAILATLLVIEIKPPHLPHEADAAVLAEELLNLWPSYLAFTIGFGSVFIMWLNHHEIFRFVRCATLGVQLANGLLLFLITLVSYSTALLADHLTGPGAALVVTIYCWHYVAICAGYNLLWWTARRQKESLATNLDLAVVRKITRTYLLGLVVYVAAALLAPFAPFVAFAASAVLWIVWAGLVYRFRRDVRMNKEVSI